MWLWYVINIYYGKDGILRYIVYQGQYHISNVNDRAVSSEMDEVGIVCSANPLQHWNLDRYMYKCLGQYLGFFNNDNAAGD